ncbi:MAG: FecR domain-containing protein [Candidatus Omnitrophica bacterium]|nr:FecR domain-containing protein [Candidatus Omnitrophota bacterium]MDD5237851.1 FecR domain-containing protein [Candidatus Omnitrophota bacterium]
MKRTLLCLVILQIFFLPVLVFAQVAKVIDVQGMVLVRVDTSHDWTPAKINMFLDKQSELKTQAKSKCTLAFDEELRNILSIDENSQIKLEEIKPGNIFLREGRVFTLIENLAKSEEFQVRTPTAIAGARGTGWTMQYLNNASSALCFVDTVYMQGLDNAGGVTREKDLSSGWGINISAGGSLGELFPLTDADYLQWNNFMDYIHELRGDDTEEVYDTGSLEDIKQEQREDYSDMVDEVRRRDTENLQPSGGSQDDDGGQTDTHR